jgi:hypothetical protein
MERDPWQETQKETRDDAACLRQRLEEGSSLEIVSGPYSVATGAASLLGLLLSVVGIIAAADGGRWELWVSVLALALSLAGLGAAAALFVEGRRQVEWSGSLVDALEADSARGTTISDDDRVRLVKAAREMAMNLDRAGAFGESRRLLRAVESGAAEASGLGGART